MRDSENMRIDARTVPVVHSWPILGSLPALACCGLPYLDAKRRELGDVFRIDLGPLSMVMLHHPEHVHHIMRARSTNYVKRGTFWTSVRSLVGTGLTGSEGEIWRLRRRMMNPQFRRQRLQRLCDVMIETIDTQLSAWPTGHRSLIVSQAVSKATMEVLVQTMFSSGINPEQSERLSEAMDVSLSFMLRRLITDALPAWVPIPGRRAYEGAVAHIDDFLYEIIKQRRTEGEFGEDLLGMLLLMQDDASQQGLDADALRDETVALFAAGYETTASTVSWALVRMARDPELYARVVAEVDRVLGARLPTADDLPRLEFVQRVFQETLRLDGPVFILPRQAVEDDVIGGFHIAAGTTVTILLERVHRHPEFWTDPDRFDPDRFLPQRVIERHPCAWIPFGTGQRKCIGEHFAMMEGVLMLSMIVQRFRLGVINQESPKAEYAIVRRLNENCRMRLFPRHHSRA